MTQEKRLGTFVVRYWWLAHGERRLDIEHVQSGDRLRCASLPEAEAWFVAHVQDQASERIASPGRPEVTTVCS